MKARVSFDPPSCIIQGHHFVQRGNRWVDTEVEKMPEARRVRVRVRFDSREFFDLLIKYPRTLPYVSTARNIELALGGTVYEIYE